jgi:uncharacterized glyoxalase superfamily protein PhnB
MRAMAEPGRSYLVSTLCYQDAKAALRWLEDAFGFEPSLVVLNDEGALLHSEMRFGESLLMVGQEAPPQARSPMSLGGTNTQKVHVQLASRIDEHCERARKAGAKILREPRTEFYGDRTYIAEDPEGHVWSFGQTVEVMSREQWNEMPGVTARIRL